MAQAPRSSWQTERVAMLKLVVERARTHVQDVRARAAIGTMAPIDIRTSETSLANLERLVDADVTSAGTRVDPTGPQRAAQRIRFAEAMNAVDLAEVKLNNGMITTAAMDASLAAAAAVFLGPPVK